MTLIEKQKAKLKELELELSKKLNDAPWVGHGGSPFVDNSTGRMRRKQVDKCNESLKRLSQRIEEQKEKIQRTEYRNANRNTQTKKSIKFIEKNGIHPGLFELQERGLVKQWEKNPQFFFVVGLKKVALLTVDGMVGVNRKYCATTEKDFEYCKNLISECMKIMA